jgi:rRNA biogenesis protein RRP5
LHCAISVIKCDDEKKRLGFSLKASNFADDSDSDEDDSDNEGSDRDKTYVMSSDNESSDDAEQDDQSIDSDDENFVAKMASKMEIEENNDEDSESGSETKSDSEEESESEVDEPEKAAFSQALDTNVGFEWNATVKSSTKSKFEEESSDESDSGSDSSDESENEDADVGFKSSHKSRKKAAARRKEEEEIYRREAALADGTADVNPETAADFERLVASSPNSSETWIKYMAFHLSLADIESARIVANRAFDRIEFRQESEKLNVWTALLTLELKFGTDVSLQETVDRACQHNNPKQGKHFISFLLKHNFDTPLSKFDTYLLKCIFGYVNCSRKK